MHTLAFDGTMGASGDMLLGALLAAGAEADALTPVEQTLDVRYDIESTTRCGITATAVDVTHEGDVEQTSHHHDDHGPVRTYPEVVEIVESMDLPPHVEDDALAIFERLGQAEASVHGTELTDTHFHEVGADDAIADVVGTVLLVADLNPDQIVTTPLATGSGSVETSHGVYPVPPPAVVELAERANWSLRGGPVERELLTPTGATILAHLAEGVESLPALDVTASGYGAGDATFESHPNALRALVGESSDALRKESITVLETNIDDAPPEVLGGLHERLQDAGALDVSVLPATMKKSRPGHVVKVVVDPENARQVAEMLAVETGTLGVREHGRGHRFVADRERRTVTLGIDGAEYHVDVKVATFDGTVFDVSGEYDDVRSVAEETGLPVREVRRRAEAIVHEDIGE